MRPDDERQSLLNSFVRYKQHIDSSIASALDTMLGPSGFHPRHADSTDWHTTPQSLRSQIRSIIWSEYHPRSLRHLPQPVPSDLPKGAEPIFTFEDAFEDLLAVSQNQPLPDIQQKYGQRKLLNQLYPRGESSFSWMKRLDAQGLLPSDDRKEQGVTSQREVREPEEKPHDWERLHEEVARRKEEVWNAARQNETQRDESNGPSLDDVVRISREIIKSSPELKKLFESLDREVFGHSESDRPWGSPARRDVNPSTDKESEQPPRDAGDRRYPGSFDEWFNQVQSFQAESNSPWEAFKKTIDLGREAVHILTEDPQFDHKQPPSKKLEEERSTNEPPKPTAEELRQAIVQDQSVSSMAFSSSVRQETDEDGRLHTIREWKKMDERGNVVDRWHDHTIQENPQNGFAKGDDATVGSQSEHERGFPADNGEVKRPGWFWK